MNCKDVEKIIKNILVEVSKVKVCDEQIKGETSIYDDLMFDSLTFIEYIVKLEEYFEISIDEDMLDLGNFEYVNSTVSYIIKRIQVRNDRKIV